MKNLLPLFLVAFLFLLSENIFSQNVMLNVLTRSDGIVKKNSVIFFEVTISNTSPTKSITSYRLRPQLSFPNNLVNIPDRDHVLPKGWIILSNKEGVVVLSNGTDEMLGNENRTILIAVKGKVAGGPSVILGNLGFSNGISPGSVSAPSLVGDSPVDNISSSTIKVIK